MKAVIYVRQFDEATIFTKVEELRKHAEEKGFDIVKVFTEVDTGALNGFGFPDWPILERCKKYCINEHPGILLVPKLHSLGFVTHGIVDVIDTFSKEGVSVHIVELDLSSLQEDRTPTPAWTLARTVLMDASYIDDEFYRMRLKAGRERYKQSGGRFGRPKGSGMTPEKTLAKYPGVASRIERNETEDQKESIEEIAAEEGVSQSTVKKVKKARLAWLEHNNRLKEGVLHFYEEMTKPETGEAATGEKEDNGSAM